MQCKCESYVITLKLTRPRANLPGMSAPYRICLKGAEKDVCQHDLVADNQHLQVTEQSGYWESLLKASQYLSCYIGEVSSLVYIKFSACDHSELWCDVHGVCAIEVFSSCSGSENKAFWNSLHVTRQ